MIITLTQIGLMLDIAGAIILLIYGFQKQYRDIYQEENLGKWPLDDRQIWRRLIYNKRVFIKRFLGVFLMLLGFLLQFVETLENKT